jgi:hypothetical protein
MLGRKELRELALRRQELVIQSQLNRLTFQIELQNVQTALQPAERLVASVRSARPWLMLLAPLAGVFAARSLGANGGIGSKLLGLLKWVQPMLALWNQFGSPSARPTPEPPPHR